MSVDLRVVCYFILVFVVFCYVLFFTFRILIVMRTLDRLNIVFFGLKFKWSMSYLCIDKYIF